MWNNTRRRLDSFATEAEYAAVNIGRFWARVKVDAGCWEWQRRKAAGYGRITWMGREVTAHRIAYRLTYGPIPDGMHVLHSCDNPGCCNPAHLRLGTHTDNMRDIVAHGYHPQATKTHCKNGHEFTTANTLHSGGKRICRACKRQADVRRGRNRGLRIRVQKTVEGES